MKSVSDFTKTSLVRAFILELSKSVVNNFNCDLPSIRPYYITVPYKYTFEFLICKFKITFKTTLSDFERYTYNISKILLKLC